MEHGCEEPFGSVSASSGYDSASQSSLPANKVRFWDTFEMDGPSDIRRGIRNYIGIIRVLKIVAFVLLNASLLLCTVCQRLTLMLLIPSGKGYRCQPTEDEFIVERLRQRLLLCCGICFPYLFIFLAGLWRFIFGKTERPSLLLSLKVVLLEMIPTGGIAFLVYHYLPNFGIVSGTAILNACCLLPSVLNMMSCFSCANTERKDVTLKAWISRTLDGTAILVQIGLIPYILLTGVYTYDVWTETIGIVICLAASSLMCWENFFEGYACLNKRVKITDKQRPILMMIVSLVKISVMFVIGIIESPKDLNKYIDILPDAFSNLWYKRTFDDTQVIVFIFSSFIGYHIAYTACKLNMQIFSFALPLLLTTPLTLLVHYLNFKKLIPVVNFESLNTSCEFPKGWEEYATYVFVLSLYWIGRHIWTPRQERMAKIEALFVAPKYCGVLFEQHLVLNRRRHEQKLDNTLKSNIEMDVEKLGGVQSETPTNQNLTPPVIYACATLWHETCTEMTQLMKSIFVMDMDYCVRKAAASTKEPTIETYEFESHIFFDDSFEYDKEERRVPNKFVKQFVELLPDAASAAHKTRIGIDEPIKIVTPYGGQLVYQLPGGSLLYVHLKDKNVIRHRKRWSQVMYMYYLLGFRIGLEAEKAIKKDKDGTRTEEFKLKKAQNTYILALDGDVDFTPDAVRMLLDKMRKNHKVGASCGRIYPIGNGPMVWYQKFEYAVAHWLQKSTEHILGCVLCSPGCFSLFRGSALMDDNVMRKYAILPSEAVHYLMYDLGEDRWLCTLLLKQGYRVDYAAAADAYTYAPEGFDEFFNQRRRWMPSTIANIMDLLQDSDATVKKNDNISRLYIIYQGTLMLSTMIGPATVLMMIAGAILTVFKVDLVQSYWIACLPASVFFLLCFWVPQKYQLFLAKLLSAFYMLIMTVVLVGCIVTAVEENPFHPSVIFLAGLVIIFLFAGILHPMDLGCLLYGALYFIGLPMGFLLLVIYSLCNLHVVSWGTREVSTVNKTKKELEEEAEQARQMELDKNNGFFARFFPGINPRELFEEWRQKKKKDDETAKLVKELSSKIDELANTLRKGKGDISDISTTANTPYQKSEVDNNREESGTSKNENQTKPQGDKHHQNEPYWTELKWLGRDKSTVLQSAEEEFWKEFIKKYLAPLDANVKIQKETQDRLIELRNGVCGGIAVINVIWIAVNFMFQLRGPGLVTIPIPSIWGEEGGSTDYLQVDVLGLSFVIFFMALLLIQFCGMVMHRWGTLLHLLAFTELAWPWSQTTLEEKKEQFLARLKESYGEKLLRHNDSTEDNIKAKKEKRGKLKAIIEDVQTKGKTDDNKMAQDENILKWAKGIHGQDSIKPRTIKYEVGTYNYHLSKTVRRRKRQLNPEDDHFHPLPDY
ncbi:chitin synthase chs-2-like isoform X2 [Pecten maximus]|uniref:chitin synthase chs-2-like isoform X2 n=1 Tax=Pecten maximus TaxID=6579 RepID=UPI001458C26E|nr:chitin synthase chs-2-like isoform X2 [Pecten maximus]